MIRLWNVSLLVTTQKLKVRGCIMRSQNISWLVGMLCLWKMQFSLCCHVPKRQVLAHGMCLIHCCLSLRVGHQMFVLLRHMFDLCRFLMMSQISPFLMQIYRMQFLMTWLKICRLEICQNGWCKLCVTANLMHLCLVALVQVLNMFLMRQIVIVMQRASRPSHSHSHGHQSWGVRAHLST